MNETTRTVGFVVVAAAVAVGAWASIPRPVTTRQVSIVGTSMFPDFKDPLIAERMEIVKFDEENATIENFDVAKVDERWVLPSKNNYPADAEQQMADAATGLVDLEILDDDVADNAAQHSLYGVKDPNDPNLKPGDTGVGTRVTMRGPGNEILAEIIIGKEVQGDPSQRYVRHGRKGRDQVYVAKIDPQKFPTDFSEWIEKDLLQLNAFDVSDITINDYSIGLAVQLDRGPVAQVDERSRMYLAYNDDNKWELTTAQDYNKEQRAWVDAGLGEDEELDNTKLNDLKYALDDLKIVDVTRKPEGLSQDLRASEDFVKNQEAFQSLIERGFYIVSSQQTGGGPAVLSSEGEIICGMKNGVEYVLRFGGIAGAGKSAANKEADTDETSHGEDITGEPDADDEEDSSPGVNRYLLVMARFNEDLIDKPELEPVPDGDATEEESSENAEDDGGETTASETEASETTEGETAADEGADAEPQVDEETESADEDSEPVNVEADAESEIEDTSKASADESANSSEEGQAADENTADDGDAVSEDDKKAQEQYERENIEKENQRKLDEYQEKVKEGQDKVKELNDRFADWYYVIANDVYDKIHLTRSDIVKTKEKSDEDSDETSADSQDAEANGDLTDSTVDLPDDSAN